MAAFCENNADKMLQEVCFTTALEQELPKTETMQISDPARAHCHPASSVVYIRNLTGRNQVPQIGRKIHDAKRVTREKISKWRHVKRFAILQRVVSVATRKKSQKSWEEWMKSS